MGDVVISQELWDFYERWRQKADEYASEDLRDCFDKFFTLFVVYNRLYAELGLSLARRRPRFSPTYLSDAHVAKRIVPQYLGTASIWNSFQDDIVCRKSIDSLTRLIEQQTFSIKLDRLYGTPRREQDLILLESLNSGNKNKKVLAIIDIIYSIRCNMFHGHKGFDGIQIQILTPVTTLLDKLSGLLFEKMSHDEDL